MEELVSVIIPTFNRAQGVLEAINSALGQSYKNLEVIVVDDGSTDETRVQVEAISDSRLKYYYKENEGLPSLARNFGVDKSKGKILAFLDSDDNWVPGKVELQVSFMKVNPGIIFCYSQAKSKRQQHFVSGKFPRKSGHIFYPLLIRNFIVTSSVLVYREYFERAGGFPVDKELPIAEDLDLWLRLSVIGRGHFFSESLVNYEMDDQGISKDFSKNFDCLYIVLKRNLKRSRSSYLMEVIVMTLFWVRRFLKLKKIN